MNLLFGITGVSRVPGGIAKANLNVLQALSDLVMELSGSLTVLSLLERDVDRPAFLTPSIKFKGFEGNQKLFAVSLLREVSTTRLFCFDHVSLSLPLLPLTAAGVVRTVIFNHGSESWKRVQRLNRLSIRHATKCLTNSHYTLKKMQERLGKFSGEACPLGLPPDFPLNPDIVERNGSPLVLKAVDGGIRTIGKRMLLLVARMLPTERGKGHYQLLIAMSDLLRTYPDVQLVFAGDGGDRPVFEGMARERGIATAVFLPGFVSLDQLKKLYEYCFAFVMPSVQEGFGITYLEAMNYGKPCIGCFDQGTEDVVVDGVTGLLVHDQNDREELLGTIKKLLDDPEQAAQLGRNGFNRLHQQFTAAHHQSRVREQISKLI